MTPVCWHMESMPVPEGEAEYGRMFLRRPDGLWLLSGVGLPWGTVPSSAVSTGGIFQWQPGAGWQRHEQAALGGDLGQLYPPHPKPEGYWMGGARWVASLDGTPAFADVSLLQRFPEDGMKARGTTGRLHRMGASPLTWTDQYGGSKSTLDLTLPTLLYPEAGRNRVLGFDGEGSPVVVDRIPSDTDPIYKTLPPPTAIDMNTPVENLRWTAAGRRHVRSGRGRPLAVLDLDAITFQPFPDLPALEGDVAVDANGPVVWLFGKPKGGPSLLVRVDASLAQAEVVPLTGLPLAAGKPWHEAQSEDTLVALDAQHLLLVQTRFGQLDAFELDLTDGQAHPVTWQGEAGVGTELYQPPPVDGPDKTNGFRPGDTVRAVAWTGDEALVMRQFGPFAGMRMRRGCTP